MTTAAAYHEDISIEKIRIDGGTQPRAEIDTSVVSDYAEKFELGETFPNVDLFFDGKNYWLADGFHRYHGAVKAHLETIPATIHRGTQRDAVLFSVGANATHGLRRTNEDKRHAVLTLLNDEEWGKKSQRWIAEKCGVHHQLVATLIAQVGESPTSSRPATTTGRDGKQYPATRATPVVDEPEESFIDSDEPEGAEDTEDEEIEDEIEPEDDSGNDTAEFRTEFVSLKEKIEKVIRAVNQMAASRLGHTPKSKKVLEHLQESVKAVESWRRSVEKD